MIHTIDDIRKKYKEYLTKAQIRELAKRDILYRQTHSAERAEALGTIRSEYDVGRRALQNMGLASRRGNLISGKEKGMRAPLERQYMDYSRNLHRIEHGYTERDAVNMANENIRRQQAAARARAEAAAKAQAEAERVRSQQEQDRLQREYDARWDKMNPNARITRTPGVKEDSYSGTPSINSTDYIPARHTKEENQRHGLELAQQQGLVGIEAIKYSLDYANGNKSKESNPFAIDRTSDKVAAAESKINELSKKIAANQVIINSASDKPISPRDSIGKMNKQKTEQARRNVAEAKSEIARIIASFSLPDNVAELVTLSDKDFQIRYDAAEKSYEKTLEYAKGLKSHQPKEANKRIREATEAFAPFEQAISVRNRMNTEALYAADVEIPANSRVKNNDNSRSVPLFVSDNQTEWKPVDWARASEWDGSNWQKAYDKKWDADDYVKTHDTKGSKYDPLVNEWAFINGRTAILYAQRFKLTQNLGNVKDIIQSAFGTDIVNRNHAYKWFIDNCVMTFNHDYETSGTKNQKKQMESMLTLANLMTDEERAKFNAILDRSGAKAADNYFEYLYNDVLPDRFVGYVRGENEFDTRDTGGIIEQSVLSVPINIAQGIAGPINSLTSKPDDQVAAMLDAMKYNTAQNLRDTVSQRLGETGGFLYGTGMSIADSAVVALISQGIGSAIGGVLGEASTVALKSGKTINIAQKAGSILGGAILGGSAFNSSYAEALQQGKTPDQAATLAVGNGLNEMIFESVSLDLLVSRFKVGDIVKVSKNNFVNAVVNTLIEGGVEGSEEVFTDLANKLWDDKISGIYSDELTKIREYMSDGMSYDQARAKVNSEFAGQLGMSFLGGAISGGIMGSGAHIANVINNRGFERIGKTTNEQDIREYNFKDKEAAELAKQSKLTNAELGMLELFKTREQLGASIEVVEKAKAEGRISEEVADIYKRFAENGFQSESNPNGVTLDEFAKMNEYADVVGLALEVREGIKGEYTAIEQQRLADEKLQNEFNAKTPEEQQRILESAPMTAAEAVSDPLGRNANTLEGLRQQRERSALAPQGRELSAETKEKVSEQIESKTGDLIIDGNTVVTEKGSGKVTFDFSTNNHTTLESMTAAERAALRLARIVAASTKSNIKIESEFTGRHKNENGYYNPITHTLHINLSGEHSAVWVMSHELTHHLQTMNERAYNDLRDEIRDELTKQDVTMSELNLDYDRDWLGEYLNKGMNLWEALNALEDKRYDEEYKGNDRAERVEEEVVARCCESFLRDSDFVRTMAKKHYRSSVEIMRFLKQFSKDVATVQMDAAVRAFEGGYDTNDISPENNVLRDFADIKRIADMWERGLREIANKRKAAKQAKMEEGRKSSTKPEMFSINDNFAKDVSEWYKNGSDVRRRFYLGKTSTVLSAFAGAELNIFMDSNKITDIKSKHRTMTLPIIQQIPDILESPILVMESLTEPGRLVVYGDVFDNSGNPVLAAVELYPTKKNGKVQDYSVVVSAYPKAWEVKDYQKRIEAIQRFINDSDIKYVEPNKKRTQTWLKRTRLSLPIGVKFGFNNSISSKTDSVNSSEQNRSSIMDKEFRMTKQGAVRTFEQRDTTATVIGSSVELDGGSLLNRVRMMQNLAEEYGSVTVDAKSEREAEAFKRAGAKKETDAFSGSEYGTWAFEHQENKYETDTQYDAKQKRQFANDVLKEIGTRKNFTRDELVRYRAALEKAFAVLHNSTYGKGDQLAAYEYADKLFDRMLDSYAEMSEADADMRDTLLSNMTRATDSRGRMYRVLEVTAKQMIEIKNAYESAAAYGRELSKALGLKVFVKEAANAKTLEDIFTHSTDTRFNAETNEGDMPGELLRIAEQTKEQRTNPYKAESAERETMKAQLWDKALDIVGVEKSTAQKVREAVKEARAEERAKAKDKLTKAVDDARLAERMHEGALRAQERRASATREAALKQRAADREAKLKETTKERLEKQRTEQLRRDVKTVALKWNQRLVKMLANPTEASHIPVQLAREVAEFTKTLTEYLDSGTQRGQINLEKVMKAYQRAFDDQATIAEAQKENPKYDPRGQVIDREMYDEQLVSMMNELNEVIKGKSFKDLSAFEMRMLLNTVRGVAHTVYDANRIIGQSERKAIWQVGSQMVDQLENAPKIGKGVRTFLEESLDLRRIALAFSGSNENAEFVKLVDQLNRGAIEKERVAQVLAGMFDGLTQQYGDEISKWYGKNAEWIDTGITKNGKKVEITKGMRVSLAMHVLNEGNMRHIENGGLTIPDRELYAKGKLSDAYANGTLVRLSAEQINEIISHMTDAEKAYVETAKEFFHKRTGYYVNKTSLQLLGYRKATVENYFPIHTDRNFTKTDFASLKMDGSIEGQGFLKERVNASNPVYLEDITSVVNRQIRGVALYAGLAVPMRNFNAVMNAAVYEDDNGVWSPRTTVKQTMTKTMGEYGSKIVEGFLTDVSEMSHVDVKPSDRIIGKIATNYVKAVLLANLKVSLKQIASYPTAAAVIPWKYLSKALRKGESRVRKPGHIFTSANVDLINQYTPLYQMRREKQANEIASIMQRRGLEQKLPALMGWITKFDVATVGRLWSAAEYMVADQQKNLTVGSDAYYKAVAKVFNDCVQQTQPNFTPLQRNAALRSKNPIIRSLVLFGTQRMQNGGIMIEAALELKNSKGKSKEEIHAARAKLGRAVASQIVQNILLIAASIGVDALRGRMKNWQDDDKEITVESLAKGMGGMFLSNAIGSFLGGSEVYDLVSALYKKATGGTVYDIDFTIPAVDSTKEILNFVSDIPDLVVYLTGKDEDGEQKHSVEDKLKKAKNWSMQLAKVFSYATGIPIENAVKDLFKGIIPAIQDHIDYWKTGEFAQWWLHQSGKLDGKKTATNYKEWTNLGKKGSTYLYWEKKLKEVKGGYEAKAEELFADQALPAEEKAILLRMLSDGEYRSEGSIVYNKNDEVVADFTSFDTLRVSMLSDKKYQGMKQAVSMGVPEDYAATAFVQYTSLDNQGSGANDKFREWLQKIVKDPEQRAILEACVIGGDGETKRYEYGKKLIGTGMSSDKAYTLLETIRNVKKKDIEPYLKGLTEAQKKLIYEMKNWKYE